MLDIVVCMAEQRKAPFSSAVGDAVALRSWRRIRFMLLKIFGVRRSSTSL